MYKVDYYVAHTVISTVLIAALSVTLHWAGDVFLRERLQGDPNGSRAISRLLDIGYYLVSIGYFTMTVMTQMPLSTPSDVARMISVKAGFLLLLLGLMHLFNMLILGLFRGRSGCGKMAEAS